MRTKPEIIVPEWCKKHHHYKEGICCWCGGSGRGGWQQGDGEKIHLLCENCAIKLGLLNEDGSLK